MSPPPARFGRRSPFRSSQAEQVTGRVDDRIGLAMDGVSVAVTAGNRRADGAAGDEHVGVAVAHHPGRFATGTEAVHQVVQADGMRLGLRQRVAPDNRFRREVGLQTRIGHGEPGEAFGLVRQDARCTKPASYSAGRYGAGRDRAGRAGTRVPGAEQASRPFYGALN